MSASRLLDRLQGVRATGPGRWMARCPAHDDRSASLSIREMDDGRVLIHDFAHCEADLVLAAVGLEFRDLYPFSDGRAHRLPSTRSRIPAADALAAIDHEAHVVAVIASDIHHHRDIDGPTWSRLALAAHRIGEARAIVAPLRVKVTA